MHKMAKLIPGNNMDLQYKISILYPIALILYKFVYTDRIQFHFGLWHSLKMKNFLFLFIK